MNLKKIAMFRPADHPERLDEIRKKYRLRRADRYTLMLLAAALDALGETRPPDATGIVVASVFGPMRTVCAFLDDLLDFPEDQVLSSTFSHSVHNAAASYLAGHFGLHGPELSLAGFERVYAGGWDTARTWIDTETCPAVLLLCAEEHGLMTDALSKHGIPVPPEFSAACLFEPGTGEFPHRPPPDDPDTFAAYIEQLLKEIPKS